MLKRHLYGIAATFAFSCAVTAAARAADAGITSDVRCVVAGARLLQSSARLGSGLSH